jgi:methylphosphotriester-DNA--protein-cysteine methyltransferase
MTKHISLANTKFARSRILKQKINSGEITLGGNLKLKIYGTLTCASGKRMKTKNRVFFRGENEAVASGFRPCGHCMREKYLAWKINNSTNRNSTNDTAKY